MYDRKMRFYGIALTIAIVGQIALAFLLYDPEGDARLINAG